MGRDEDGMEMVFDGRWQWDEMGHDVWYRCDGKGLDAEEDRGWGQEWERGLAFLGWNRDNYVDKNEDAGCCWVVNEDGMCVYFNLVAVQKNRHDKY